MINTIITFAGLFVSVFMRLGGGNVVQDALLSLPFGKWGVFFIMMSVIFILGLLMDWIASLLIIVPIFTPIAATLGFDPFWFAYCGLCYVSNFIPFVRFKMRFINQEGVEVITGSVLVLPPAKE